MALSGSITTNYWYDDTGKTRGYALSWTAKQSIADNSSEITWSLKTAGTYKYEVAERTLKVVLAGKTLLNKTDRVMRGPGEVANGKFTIKHDSEGKLKISGSIQAAVFGSGVNCSASKEWTVDTIPRQAKVLTAPNFNDEDNPEITYSNPAGNIVTSLQACISLTGAKADIPYRDIAINGSSYKFELTDEERKTLRVATVGSNSRMVKFRIKTEIAGNTYNDDMERKFSVINAQPTLEPSVVDVNEYTKDLTGNERILVKNFSNAQVISGAKVYKDAIVKSQKVICGNKSLEKESGTIEGISSGAFIFSITDNRENTETQTENVPLIEYVNLTCNLQANAPDAEGDMKFFITGNCFSGSFGEKDNVVDVYYQYKENDSEYGEWQQATNVITNDNTYTAEVNLEKLDYRNRFTFQAKAKDALMEVQSVERVVKTIPVFDWGEFDFNFNVPVMMSGVELEYPVESGTSGVWTYRKWNTGLAMCWGSISADYDSGQGTTTMPSSTAYSQRTCPFPENLFVETPFIMPAGIDAGSGVVSAEVESASTNKKCVVLIWGNANAFGNVNVLAIGRWKE